MRIITLEIGEATPLLNKMLRQHHRERKREIERLAWMIRADSGKPPATPMERCAIHVDRYSAGTPDWDGLYGGLKNLLDCLVVQTDRNPHGLGFIRDDKPKHIIALTALPHYAPKGQGRTVVRITEVEATEWKESA